VSQYCDIIAIRAFAGLVDKDKDNAETVAGFLKYATVPVVNMEGARSPIAILADAITMEEFKQNTDQRSFYPGHHTALPQAVLFLRGNDAIERSDFVITHPEGYELNPLSVETKTSENDFINSITITTIKWKADNITIPFMHCC
jgi:N-succinyl-L-ornithine transcarbamylase